LRLPHGFFRRAIESSGMALLVDGLDEVLEDSAREQLMKSVNGLAKELSVNCLAVITSRPFEYERTPFDVEDYPRHFLCEFNDDEIQKFIAGWRSIRETSPSAAKKANRELWEAIRQQPHLREMAANPLLLTMITCVHLWRGELPDSRVHLYRVCAESLVDNWSTAVGLGMPEISQRQKLEFLAELAYHLQSTASVAQMMRDQSGLEISRQALHERIESFLERKRKDTALADQLLQRLYTRQAILLHFGGDRFRFIHRSFQEYFAGWWLNEKKGPPEMRQRLDNPGWRETVALAVALSTDRERQKFLLDLLRESRVEDALYCLPGAGQDVAPWLAVLVRFLAKRTWEGRSYSNMPAAECISGDGRTEVLEVLDAIFTDRSDGAVLAAAVDLAEELGRAGEPRAAAVVDGFFALGKEVEREMVNVPAGRFLFGAEDSEREVYLDAFAIDKYPVTNADYRKMVPRYWSDKELLGRELPVGGVNWYEAQLYARWCGCVLPSDEQWEKAVFWDEEKQQKCSKRHIRAKELRWPMPVEKMQSPYGCDMSDDVYEWTGDDADRKKYGEIRFSTGLLFVDDQTGRIRRSGFCCART
jgi:hypothetical protein